jgi:hypothetical protein
MHVSQADLRAHVDGELAVAQLDVVERHLAGCPDCRVRLVAVTRQAERVQATLAALAPTPGEAARPAGLAQQVIRDRQRKDNYGMRKSIFGRRPVWAGLAAVAVLAVAFSFAPVRAWAGEFLSLFRVQQIAVVPIDITRLSGMSGDRNLAEQISQLFTDTLNVTKEPGDPVVAASAAEASQLAGFTVRGLSGPGTEPVYTVQDGAAFELTLNRERAQAILDGAGRGDLQLPAAFDGAQISVEIPTAVTAAYGGCPTEDLEGNAGEGERVDWSALQTCVMLAQVPSPTVNAPPDLNVAQLAEMALQFTGMTAEEAAAFSASVDWTSTLVVPIPSNAADYTQVSVDGVTGTLIYREANDESPWRYMLMWVKDGIIYALSGFGSQAQALDMAGSIQ